MIEMAKVSGVLFRKRFRTIATMSPMRPMNRMPPILPATAW